jgi:hypothetical protein
MARRATQSARERGTGLQRLARRATQSARERGTGLQRLPLLERRLEQVSRIGAEPARALRREERPACLPLPIARQPARRSPGTPICRSPGTPPCRSRGARIPRCTFSIRSSAADTVPVMRELLLGLLLGLLAGYLVFGGVRTPTPDPTPDPAPAATPPDPVRRVPTLERAAQAVPSASSASPAGLPDRSPVFDSASGAELEAAFRRSSRLRDGEAKALIERLAQAQRAKDASLFLRLVRILGTSGHPAALTHLVALVADTDADLPEAFLETVQPFLSGAEVSGLVAAAEARVESEPAAGRARWVEVIAARGASAQIDALLDRRDGHIHPQIAYMQLMSRPLEEARAYLARAEAAGAPWVNFEHVLGRFAEAHPEAGRTLLLEGLRAFDAGQETWRGLAQEPHAQLLAHRLAATTSIESWPRVAAALTALRSPSVRLQAVRGVAIAVGARGLDAGVLGDLVNEPARAIRAILEQDSPSPDAETRLWSLAYNLVNALPSAFPCTEENMRALESAAATWQGGRRDELQRLAAAYRAALDDKGRRWR